MPKLEEYNVICIDGGGTKTNGVLYAGETIVSQLKGGSTRIGPVGYFDPCERVLNIIIELCNAASISTSEVDIIVVGLAGV